MKVSLDELFDFIAAEQAKTPDLACPRCGQNPVVRPLVRNALSRIDNRVYICSACGMDEAFSGDGKATALADAKKWHVVKALGFKLPEPLDGAVHEYRVRVRGSYCSIRVMLSGDRIHVLDLDDGVSLTNAIDEKFQRSLLRILGSERSPESFTWVLYHTDCVPSVFERGSFRPAPADVLDGSFLIMMNEMYGGDES